MPRRGLKSIPPGVAVPRVVLAAALLAMGVGGAGQTAGLRGSMRGVDAPGERPPETVPVAPGVRATGHYEQFHVYRDGGPIVGMYGTLMTEGVLPAQAADRWFTEFRGTLGIRDLDLHLQRSNQVHLARFTVFAYQQFIDGLPVEHGFARLLVLNGTPDRVVYFAGKLTPPPAAGFRADTLDGAGAVASVRRLGPYATLTHWSVPEMVVFYGGRDVEPAFTVRAWKFAGRRAGDSGPEVYTFFVDASDGRLVHVRDEIYRADITGHVSGSATPGTLPDVPYNPPVETSIENVRVEVVAGPGTFTDENGDYVLPYDGPVPAVVQADLIGQWVKVLNFQGVELHLEGTYPPAPVDFFFNAAPEEFSTSQVNGFVQTTRVHDFYKDRQPDFYGLDFPITCWVNETGPPCNARYNPDGPLGHEIAFPKAGAMGGGETCVNMAYTSVIAHEYGHFIVNQLGLQQGAFGEGFGDSVALLLYDDPVMGRDYAGPGTYGRNIEAANKQYPCDEGIHECGQVLAGCWWDIRLELQASLGDPAGLGVARQLFTDWSQITIGGSGSDSAHPLTVVEVLVADDDDGSLVNGTPHDCEIVWGFRAHGIDTFAVLVDCDSNGTPDVCEGDPDCNSSGVRDVCDVAFGTSGDCNTNGVPDECEFADFDGDGEVNLSDYQTFYGCFTGPCLDPPCDPPLYPAPCCPIGDVEPDGDLDLADFAAFQEAFAVPGRMRGPPLGDGRGARTGRRSLPEPHDPTGPSRTAFEVGSHPRTQ